jgi:hypothetical protein
MVNSKTDRSVKFGLISIWLGSIAIALAWFCSHAQSILTSLTGSAQHGFLLPWLDRHGFARQGAANNPVAEPLHWLSLNDAKLVALLAALAGILVGLAVVFSFVAEKKQEDSLYPAAGYIFATLAMAMLQIWLGLAFLVCGLAGLLGIRSLGKKTQFQEA